MVNATDNSEGATNSSEVFNPKINNWVEGVILAIDADNSGLTLRGAKRPFASEYGMMLKDIFEKTKSLTRANRESRASAIRLDWNDALEKAHALNSEKDADMIFRLPGKETKLVLVDEGSFSRPRQKFMMHDKQPVSLTDRECKDVDALKDLQIGQKVMVGYDSGLVQNDAYVVIKGNDLQRARTL